ncbi:MAG: hypothetical protein IPK19_39310 [Chloroflexi bacterium]|nr:hypothetical protein [Chloroflexota bacterium]
MQLVLQEAAALDTSDVSIGAVAICQGQVIERIGEQIAPLTHLVMRRRHPNHRVGQRRIGPPADET